eukprot:gene10156-11193_t
MEDSFLATFSIDLKLTSEENDTTITHPRFSDFKQTKQAKRCDQEHRRAKMIERQKSKRYDCVNYARKLVDGELTENDIEVDEDEQMKEHSKEKKFNPFKNQLMLSEWLVDVPADLIEQWTMTVCPVGKRCLVVANRGSTSVYTKSGYCVNRFPSLLPGGCKQTLKPGEYTVLDCIYSEVSHTFYIIDLTCWRGHPVYDSETEFRMYWLKTKLEDEEDLKQKSRLNPYVFIQAPVFGCSVAEIEQALSSTYPFQVDGVLFYHKRAHYSPGRTPLVAWLKPYMVPQILGVELPRHIVEHAPSVNKRTMLDANTKLRDCVRDRGSMEIVNGEDVPVEMT